MVKRKDESDENEDEMVGDSIEVKLREEVCERKWRWDGMREEE